MALNPAQILGNPNANIDEILRAIHNLDNDIPPQELRAARPAAAAAAPAPELAKADAQLIRAILEARALEIAEARKLIPAQAANLAIANAILIKSIIARRVLEAVEEQRLAKCQAQKRIVIFYDTADEILDKLRAVVEKILKKSADNLSASAAILEAAKIALVEIDNIARAVIKADFAIAVLGSLDPIIAAILKELEKNFDFILSTLRKN